MSSCTNSVTQTLDRLPKIVSTQQNNLTPTSKFFQTVHLLNQNWQNMIYQNGRSLIKYLITIIYIINLAIKYSLGKQYYLKTWH